MAATQSGRIGARHAAIRQTIIERLVAENPGLRGWALYTVYLRDNEGKNWPTACIWNDLNKMLADGRLRTEIIGPRRARHYYINTPTETPNGHPAVQLPATQASVPVY